MRTFGMNMAADLSRCKIALYRRWGEEEATVEATLQTELEQPDLEQEEDFLEHLHKQHHAENLRARCVFNGAREAC